MIYYNAFGEFKSERNIEGFANEEKTNVMEKIQEFKKNLESGKISKEQVSTQMIEFRKMIKDGKLTDEQKKALEDVVQNTVRQMDGINLVGNLELGGIIKARGFHLHDGTPVKEVIKTKDKLAVPIDEQGNINIRSKIDKGDVNIGSKKGNINFESNIVNLNSVVDIEAVKRTGKGPSVASGLYVTATANPGGYNKNAIAEFRHTNQTQGIGIGYNTIYAAGTNANQDVNIIPKGSGKVTISKKHHFHENGTAHHRGSVVADEHSHTKRNSYVKGDIVKNGGNNWIFHTPDDKRHTLYIAPSKTKGKQDWDWSKQTRFEANGQVVFNGDTLHQRNSYVKNDIIKNGGNNWIFHTPDDSRHTLYIAPSKTKGKQDWNWSKQTRFEANGEVVLNEGKHSKHNPTGWSTHFNHKGQGLNYIRGQTEMRGEVNFVDKGKGINIHNAKSNYNPNGWGTHFNHQGKGLNYIRGQTEINGREVNFHTNVGINIHNGKHSNFNRHGHATHFNHKGQGLNYIRGRTEILGETHFADRERGVNIHNAKSNHNPTGWGTHFNHQGKGLNYIRGQTEIRGPNVDVITNNGVKVHGHGKKSTFGSLNSGWCHLTTNAPQFYMNKGLQVHGHIRSYSDKPINADKGVNAPHYSRIGGDWLRINPEGNSAGRVAVYGGFSINDVRGGKAGLGVGYWGYPGRGNIRATGNIEANNGLKVTGGRSHFKDAENRGRLRVGAAWGIPGLYSEDRQDIVVGCANNRNVHLGRPNLVRIDGAGNLHLPGNANIYIGGRKVVKNGDPITLRSNRNGTRLQHSNWNQAARFSNRNRGVWERLYVETF